MFQNGTTGPLCRPEQLAIVRSSVTFHYEIRFGMKEITGDVSGEAPSSEGFASHFCLDSPYFFIFLQSVVRGRSNIVADCPRL